MNSGDDFTTLYFMLLNSMLKPSNGQLMCILPHFKKSDSMEGGVVFSTNSSRVIACISQKKGKRHLNQKRGKPN
jgi:hypothetical protein